MVKAILTFSSCYGSPRISSSLLPLFVFPRSVNGTNIYIVLKTQAKKSTLMASHCFLNSINSCFLHSQSLCFLNSNSIIFLESTLSSPLTLELPKFNTHHFTCKLMSTFFPGHCGQTYLQSIYHILAIRLFLKYKPGSNPFFL